MLKVCRVLFDKREFAEHITLHAKYALNKGKIELCGGTSQSLVHGLFL